jgi:hypothetical protein
MRGGLGAASLAVAAGLALTGCVPFAGFGAPAATFSFADGQKLGARDAGAIAFYADLGDVPGWVQAPGGDADHAEFVQASTGCSAILQRIDASGQDYLHPGDDATSSAAIVDSTSGLHENRTLRARSLLALGDPASTGNQRTVDVIRIVFAPAEAGVTTHDAALVRVFADAGVGLVAEADCRTDEARSAAMQVLRQHVAFVVER